MYIFILFFIVICLPSSPAAFQEFLECPRQNWEESNPELKYFPTLPAVDYVCEGPKKKNENKYNHLCRTVKMDQVIIVILLATYIVLPVTIP